MSKKTRYEIGMYQRTMAVGATPFERLSTMYMGAMRLTKQGLQAAEAGHDKRAADKAERLMAVIRRLDMSLDFTIAPDLCKNLSQLYVHIQARLSEPNAPNDPEVFRETLQLLETLWDGFKNAENSEKD
jgi:flagellar biosynthetic protein FliS